VILFDYGATGESFEQRGLPLGAGDLLSYNNKLAIRRPAFGCGTATSHIRMAFKGAGV
jgi:hypothetical protein